ncbi:MAG: alpha/beta fold hydrolase [Caldilineaceae bacterium SB0661_bin_32]|uniref:Alpha/beta fold hydrolase n=1 Tax=Caldilineaceae bacterium SB0661_bin_32 TaxID=2605255 RepID=A0A6B1D4E6_9CHLR|nr:alpha/beta fold hydrolase [Caldilineaceae bacterium SB0661_bin_32]
MRQSGSPARPAWLSDEIYPFESSFFTTPSGHEMHYIDEGAGEPVVFLHGNPTWSFEFRHLIRDLRSQYRCIAPDQIGFGLSARSRRSADYRPEAHADATAALLKHLNVQDATLYLVDWGGPIGLDFARKHPERVKRLVVTNTWCWPVGRDPHYVMFSFFMSSWLGQYLIKRRNFFVNRVLPMAVASKEILTPEVMAHYRNAQPTPEARAACAAFPGYIVGAGDWLRSIWDDRAAFTAKPALIFWGFKDIAFREKELNRWKTELADFELHELRDCGHFLAEEAPGRMLPVLHDFMERTR